MTVPLEQAAVNLAAAVVFGSVIGFERQWRHRLAGLRTNTLVALGAASFVVFEALVPEESSPTRVAAQVVSGVGFLGAGVIFREGLNVRGLNTAATLPRRRQRSMMPFPPTMLLQCHVNTVYVIAVMTSLNCGVDVICHRAIEPDSTGRQAQTYPTEEACIAARDRFLAQHDATLDLKCLPEAALPYVKNG